MRLVLLGAPGSGKGTQAARLKEYLQIPHISTGDLLRGEVAAGTKLGLEAKEVMARGELVSDAILLGMLEERFSREDTRGGFILDGYPRNLAQAAALDELDAVLATLPTERRGLPVVLSVGRLHAVKGMATLARAWADHPDLADRCNLVIVGGDLNETATGTARSFLAPLLIDPADQTEHTFPAASPTRRIDAILDCRTALEQNVKPQIALEALTVALRLPA